MPQQEKPSNGKPTHLKKEKSPLVLTRESPCSKEDPTQSKLKKRDRGKKKKKRKRKLKFRQYKCLRWVFIYLFQYVPFIIFTAAGSNQSFHSPAFKSNARFSSVQLLSSVQLFAIPWTRLPVHQLPKFTQTHVHWVDDDIQPFYPVLCLSPPAFNLSQHQGLFKGISSSHQVAKIFEFQVQHQSFQRTLRTDFL